MCNPSKAGCKRFRCYTFFLSSNRNVNQNLCWEAGSLLQGLDAFLSQCSKNILYWGFMSSTNDTRGVKQIICMCKMLLCDCTYYRKLLFSCTSLFFFVFVSFFPLCFCCKVVNCWSFIKNEFGPKRLSLFLGKQPMTSLHGIKCHAVP